MRVCGLPFVLMLFSASCVIALSPAGDGETGTAKRTNAQALSAAADTAEVTLVAKERWGERVRQVKRIKSRSVLHVFPGCKVFRVNVYNPFSRIAGPALYPHSILLDGGTAIILENHRGPEEETDLEAAELLTKRSIRVFGYLQIKLLIDAFAEIRGFRLQEGKPDIQKEDPIGDLKLRYGTEAEDWKFAVSETSDRWQITCAFLADGDINLFVQYHFEIDRDGRIVPKFVKKLYQGGGYI